MRIVFNNTGAMVPTILVGGAHYVGRWCPLMVPTILVPTDGAHSLGGGAHYFGRSCPQMVPTYGARYLLVGFPRNYGCFYMFLRIKLVGTLLGAPHILLSIRTTSIYLVGTIWGHHRPK